MDIDPAWAIRKLVEYVVLPPTPLVLLITLGAWRHGATRWGRWVWPPALATLVLLSMPAIGNLIQAPLERSFPPLEDSAVQSLPRSSSMIVVLGGGTTLGAIEYPEGETLSPTSLLRCRYAARLAAVTGLPVGVSSGKASGARLSEAVLMRRFLESELRQPVAYSEERSLDTLQSAIFTARELGRMNVRSVVLVTDALHMRRAKWSFERAGVTVVAAPMNFRAGTPVDMGDFLPSVWGLSLSQDAFHEIIGYAWYSARASMSGILK